MRVVAMLAAALNLIVVGMIIGGYEVSKMYVVTTIILLAISQLEFAFRR